MELPVHLVHQDYQDLRDLQAQQAALAHWDHLDPSVRLVVQVLAEDLDLLVQQVT